MSEKCYDEETTTHKVVIFKGGDGKVKVSQGYVFMKKKDKIKFKAVKANLSIFIPELKFKAVPPDSKDEANVFDLAAGKTKTLVPDETGISQEPKSGEYSYAIYCKESKEFVKANSPPAMIVEPEEG